MCFTRKERKKRGKGLLSLLPRGALYRGSFILFQVRGHRRGRGGLGRGSRTTTRTTTPNAAQIQMRRGKSDELISSTFPAPFCSQVIPCAPFLVRILLVFPPVRSDAPLLSSAFCHRLLEDRRSFLFITAAVEPSFIFLLRFLFFKRHNCYKYRI